MKRTAPCTLADLAVGMEGRVDGVDGEPGMAQRLLEMGLLPGTPVRVVRRAPLGDPLEIRVRGYALSLRERDARLVRVHGS